MNLPLPRLIDEPQEARDLAKSLSELHSITVSTYGRDELWDAMTMLRRYASLLESLHETT